ncbi:mediator complex subunit MED18, putative [Babesia caballi]|uniref:Mediator complex subunit MED18, putative n=1 Tax=Babesia caballi TaxID=5871 RepID=A0AAV4M2M2_BABCB|nr:mediator complex subunit MED18, putative [Babesia caballi]
MASSHVPDYVANWREGEPDARPPAEPAPIDSEAELDSFLQECQAHPGADPFCSAPRAQHEYVVSGIFKDPSVRPAAAGSAEPRSPSTALRCSDPLFSSALYREFLDTLSHLMDTQRVVAYERLTYRRAPLAGSRGALNFTSNVDAEERKTLVLCVHKPPGPLAGQCTLVEVDHERASASSADVVVRPAGYTVGIDMATVLPLCGYDVVKRLFVCGHVFTRNHGNPSQVEVAVLRHYVDCDPTMPVSPNTMLVEVRCTGDGDLETYKARLLEHSGLLYKYVEFALS